MARRKAGVELPEHVHRVTARGKIYLYFQAGRNTPKQGTRVSLPSDPQTPEFWEAYRALAAALPRPTIGGIKPGSIADLVLQFAGDESTSRAGSPEWDVLAEGTKVNYRIYLDRMVAAWGTLLARDLRPKHALAARDQMRGTPFAANSFLAVGATLFKWGVPREFAELNPFREIERLDTEGSGHIPWPRWAIDFCIKHAPEDLGRFVFLALHSGQRESDVVRLGPPDRDGAGLWVKPKKTGKRRGRFWVPLTTAVLLEVERIEREPVTFVNPRFKARVVVPTGQTYVFSPRGRAYTPDSLRSRWNRWLAGADGGKELRARWQEYCRLLAERAGEEFEEEEAKQPALHGLRGSAVVVRRMAGAAHQQIANDIGMSLPMVMHYSRFMDQKAAAESNIALLEDADRQRG